MAEPSTLHYSTEILYNLYWAIPENIHTLPPLTTLNWVPKIAGIPGRTTAVFQDSSAW